MTGYQDQHQHIQRSTKDYVGLKIRKRLNTTVKQLIKVQYMWSTLYNPVLSIYYKPIRFTLIFVCRVYKYHPILDYFISEHVPQSLRLQLINHIKIASRQLNIKKKTNSCSFKDFYSTNWQQKLHIEGNLYSAWRRTLQTIMGRPQLLPTANLHYTR